MTRRRTIPEARNAGPTAIGPAAFDPQRAQLLAERFHGGQLEPIGTPLIAHVTRVALATPEFARPVAWLHEVLEWTSVSEEELLNLGISDDELRALRLLNRSTARGSREGYIAHIKMIVRADGHAGRLARAVKLADLQDRLRHDHRQADGSRLPYEHALELISDAVAADVAGSQPANGTDPD